MSAMTISNETSDFLRNILIKLSIKNEKKLKKLSNFSGLSFTANPDEIKDSRKHKELS